MTAHAVGHRVDLEAVHKNKRLYCIRSSRPVQPGLSRARSQKMSVAKKCHPQQQSERLAREGPE